MVEIKRSGKKFEKKEVQDPPKKKRKIEQEPTK